MKFILDNWSLIAVVLGTGLMLMWPTISGGGAHAVSPEGAVMLMNHEKAVVVDVCEPAEYAGGHVVGAKNIPLGKLQERLPQAVKNKATPVILVCYSGMRSNRAVAIAKGLGFEKPLSLTGGMSAWRKANLPVEKA